MACLEADAACPKPGPDPILLKRKEVDALYDTLAAIIAGLDQLGVDYIVTGGSLLGAVRQHSILFCDDDIDIAIIENNRAESGERLSAYDTVAQNLAGILGDNFIYSVRPWEGGDKIRPRYMPSVFVDLFTLRRFENLDQLTNLVGVKKNGQPQSEEYIQKIVSEIETSAFSQSEQTPLCPFWHFNTRKAVEMWPKEVYREHELFPLSSDLKFGPLTGVKGPRTPVLLLKRAFGLDCFEVYYQSGSHQMKEGYELQNGGADLKPLVGAGGTWEGGKKVALSDEHYLPMQPLARTKRRPTPHGKEQLLRYLSQQMEREQASIRNNGYPQSDERPKCTVYMDGVFDLFHVGHLQAIQQCVALGNKVIIGVTGDADAGGYKRAPVISQENRVSIVKAIRDVDAVICPCPLVVTQEFMEEHGIDLVVHGFASDADAKQQEEFFRVPVSLGKFKRIDYYSDLSTTDIIQKIRRSPS